MKAGTILGACCLALGLAGAGRLSAKSDVTLEGSLKWVDKHRADLRAEWHSAEGPTKWQPDDFKNYSGMQDWYWDRTIRWTTYSDCPVLGKGLERDGETYTITRAVSHVGAVTDKSEQDATSDAFYTRTVSAGYTWRLKVSQISAETVVMDYKEYLQRTSQPDNRTVDVGTYYYICVMPKPDADMDAIIEMEGDQKIDDSRGSTSTAKGYKTPVAFAGIATVHDRKMAEGLATALGHIIGLLQVQRHPKEPE